MKGRSNREMKLEDVAPKAGAGTATVSRVLNNQPGVKKYMHKNSPCQGGIEFTRMAWKYIC
jgi:Bacterial regulatory proteins, lacI family